MCGRQHIGIFDIVFVCVNWEDVASKKSKLMSELHKHFHRLIASLVLSTCSFSGLAAESASSNVSITKAIPCSSYSPVMKMRSMHGQPKQILWARAVNGQMSVFVWKVNNGDDAETRIVTYLSDTGRCSTKDEQDKSLDWRVLNAQI